MPNLRSVWKRMGRQPRAAKKSDHDGRSVSKSTIPACSSPLIHQPIIRHDAARGVFTMRVSKSKGSTCRLEYTRSVCCLNITHTFVPVNLRGRGLAAHLCDAVYRYAHEQQVPVMATCTYVNQVYEPLRLQRLAAVAKL